MKKIVALVFVLTVLGCSVVSSALAWPDYQNGTRSMGRVNQVFSTTIGGHPWVAFVITATGPSGAPDVRYDCDVQAVALACDQVHYGDTVLVSGHQVDRLSCHWDGIDNFNVPNIIWNCNPTVSAPTVPGPCVQLTQ